MNLSNLNERFSVPGVLNFGATDNCLTYAEIHAPAADAKVFMQGGQIVQWQPHGFDPVLYLSPRSEYVPGKPIRGGVPVVFPWFGPRAGSPQPPHIDEPGPSHGFARTHCWEPVFAAVSGEDLHLTLALAPNRQSHEYGFNHFRVAVRFRIGRTLAVELAVANEHAATEPLVFEEALHTYFRVKDAARVAVHGLAGAEYIDKRDNALEKVQPDAALTFTEATDRVFLDTDSTCTIEDAAGRRRIVVQKSGSRSTVVWNPWSTLTPTLADMEPNGWQSMVCVETANVDRNAITLAPGESHMMRLNVAVEKIA